MGRRRAHVLLRPPRRRDAAATRSGGTCSARRRPPTCACIREDDERFYLGVERTRSGRFILIDASSKLTSEVWFVPTDAPEAEPQRHRARATTATSTRSSITGARSAATGSSSSRTRAAARATSSSSPRRASIPARQYWTPLVPHRDDVKLDAVNAFADHFVLSERANGLERLRVMHVESGAMHEIEMPDPVYSVWVGADARVRDDARCATDTRRSSRR